MIWTSTLSQTDPKSAWLVEIGLPWQAQKNSAGSPRIYTADMSHTFMGGYLCPSHGTRHSPDRQGSCCESPCARHPNASEIYPPQQCSSGLSGRELSGEHCAGTGCALSESRSCEGQLGYWHFLWPTRTVGPGHRQSSIRSGNRQELRRRRDRLKVGQGRT